MRQKNVQEMLKENHWVRENFKRWKWATVTNAAEK